MLNLWVGLCKGVPGLPTNIHDLRYRDGYIERTITTQNNQRCKPELIIESEAQQHAVLFEWKDGANTVIDQLVRYSRLTPTQVQNQAAISANAAKAFDVAVVGKAEHGDRLKIGIEQTRVKFPLLLVDEGGISLALNAFKNKKLNDLFAPKLTLNFTAAPRNFVPIDAQSTMGEIAQIVMPAILERMYHRDTSVTSEVLCSDICRLWSTMEKQGKCGMRSAVSNVLQQAADAEFKEHLKWKKQNDGCVIEFVSNPIAFKSDRRSAAWRKMQGLMHEFQMRLAANKLYERPQGLFDHLG